MLIQMPTQISPHRKKYAFYLREKPLSILRVVVKRNNCSLSKAICLILNQYQEIKKRNPGAIAMAKSYCHKLKFDFTEGEYVSKNQAYLNSTEQECLETYAKQNANGNLSHGLNKLIGEYACLATVCPDLFKNQS